MPVVVIVLVKVEWYDSTVEGKFFTQRKRNEKFHISSPSVVLGGNCSKLQVTWLIL